MHTPLAEETTFSRTESSTEAGLESTASNRRVPRLTSVGSRVFCDLHLEQVSGRRAERHIRFAALVFSDVASALMVLVVSWLLYEIASIYVASIVIENTLDALSGLKFFAVFALPLAVVWTCSFLQGHYTRFKPFWMESLDLLRACLYGVFLGVFLLFYLDSHFSRVWFTLFWILLLFFTPIGRLACKHWLISQGCWFRPLVIVGGDEESRAVQDAIESDPVLGQRVVGVIGWGAAPADRDDDEGALTQHGGALLEEVERRYGRVELVCAPGAGWNESALKRFVDRWMLRNSVISVSPNSNGLSLYGASTVSLFSSDVILLSLKCNLARWWDRRIKRLFDIVVSLALLVVLSPLLLPLLLLIKLDGGPLLFASERVGRGGQVFRCFKLRSMVTDAEARLAARLRDDPAALREWSVRFKLTDDPRITPVGRFVRKTSLDELPQLLNVLRGDMSLVGPRPILPCEVATYGDDLELYCLTRPGITGLWQVLGRSTLEQADRVRFNSWYVRNWSLWTDIVILLKTIPVTLRGCGAG